MTCKVPADLQKESAAGSHNPFPCLRIISLLIRTHWAQLLKILESTSLPFFLPKVKKQCLMHTMSFWLYVSFPKECEIIKLDAEKLNLEKAYIIKNPKADGLTKGWEEVLGLQLVLINYSVFRKKLGLKLIFTDWVIIPGFALLWKFSLNFFIFF